MQYEMTFKAPSGRIFTVVASEDTLKDLTHGYSPGCGRPAQANGELKGVSVRFPGEKKPSFARGDKQHKTKVTQRSPLIGMEIVDQLIREARRTVA